LLVGAMEFVPPDMIDEVRRDSIIHPWTIVDQGGGKWRLCHDYSVGTNRYVSTSPFVLPEVWDVRHDVKPTSFFAKYDVRWGEHVLPGNTSFLLSLPDNTAILFSLPDNTSILFSLPDNTSILLF
jgi:hypothetical protein